MMKNGGCATKVLPDQAINFEKSWRLMKCDGRFEFSSGIGSFVC